ncbi:MAG: HNH endonuclease [Alphaproteobacteria bacterium]
MIKCIFCENDLGPNTPPEHILLNALGGRKTTTQVDCSQCNHDFGDSIDKVITAQVPILRNMLQLDSGTGKAPPMIKNIQAGDDKFNLRNDGSPELNIRPFLTSTDADGNTQIQITVQNIEDIKRFLPHIAAQIGCTEEKLIENLQNSQAMFVSQNLGAVHFPLSFGGPEPIRSISKSCMVLWATLVGNEELRSPPYSHVRHFVKNGDDNFNRNRSFLDSRLLPQSEKLSTDYGPLFNFIYVTSNDAGRVVGHFTLYNMVSWCVVLAESGGTPNKKIGLISNPIDPSVWSDQIAEEINIDSEWLEKPDHQLQKAKSRIEEVIKYYLSSGRKRELDRITNEVFKKYGVEEDDDVIAVDQESNGQLLREILTRTAFYMTDVPYEEPISGEELLSRLGLTSKVKQK